MNKNELITLLRNPNDLSVSDLNELEKVVEENPFFMSGRLLLAKASKDLKHPDTKKRITSAAAYSTDRPLLKKYLSDRLFFLSEPPQEEEIANETEDQSKKSTDTNKQQEKVVNREKEEVPEKSPKKDNTKESVKPIETDQTKQRREPRFDPSATVSSKRRWGTEKDSSEKEEPKSSTAPKAKSNVVFAGKKVERTNRVKKRSIRAELLSEEAPQKKTPESKVSQEAKPTVAKKPTTTPTTNKTSKETAQPKEEKERKKSKSAPSSFIQSSTKKVVKTDAKKESVSSVENKPKPSPKKETTQRKEENQPSIQKEKKASDNLISQQKSKASPPTPAPVQKAKIKVPQAPSDGIDAILEELKRDMEDLKTSRVKFTEVQQKIEEEDAVSAAVERATKKIPGIKPEPEKIEKEVTLKGESQVSEEIKEIAKKEESKTEQKEKKEETKDEPVSKLPVEKQEESASTKKMDQKEKPITQKKETKEAKNKPSAMPKAKKVTPTKKKATSAKKKVTPSKKTSSKKTNTAKPKSSTSKSPIKEEKKKDDDKSGKQQVDQNSIIDKFIAETPSIKYQKKKEPIENEDLSDQSTEWNKELASEYLAEIYLHQGNKKRAIEIYKALSLKFPNKKSYFADLISKTK